MTVMGQRLKFEGVVTLGHILQSLVILGAVFMAFTSLRETDASHAARIQSLEDRAAMATLTNQQILNTLTTIREDIATLKERSQRN